MRRLLIHVVDSEPHRAARVAANAVAELGDIARAQWAGAAYIRV